MVAVRKLDAATDAAVDWMVLLRSGSATAQDRQAFTAWHGAHADHAAAWTRLQGAVSAPCMMRNDQGSQASALRHARDILLQPPRRVVLKSLLGAGVLVGLGGAGANRWVPVADLAADMVTGTGERQRYTLPDASVLVLNARSAVDVQVTGTRREVRLRAGELVATVTADPVRPFSVITAQGSVTALGTRFLVRQNAGSTRVAVLQHSVEIRTLQGARHVLQRGQGADFDAVGIRLVDISLSSGAEWLNGHLVVNNQPLSYVIAELQRYRRGILRVSPQAAGIAVQGGFPLDDVDASLAGLVDTLPITVDDYGGWVTLIDTR